MSTATQLPTWSLGERMMKARESANMTRQLLGPTGDTIERLAP